MNLRQLQYFKTIAELEHYTRAAEKLYVSQSNLSHSIQELEDELNVEFFVRKGRNIKLTKYGELFLPYVSQALNLLDTGVARLQDYINPNSGTVVIDDPRVEGALIGEHQIVLLVPESHRLAQRESVDLRELDGEPFISFDNNCQLRSVTDELFRSLGIQPKITMETAQDVIMYGMVAANHGVAIVPRPLGGPPYNVKVLPIENEIPARKLYIQWNKEQYMPPAAEYFRDFIIRSGLIFNHFLERHNLKEGS